MPLAPGEVIFSVVLYQLVCGLIANLIAVRKGYNRNLWLILGSCLGIIGVAIIWFMAPTAHLFRSRSCPRCTATIWWNDTTCRHCAHVLLEHETLRTPPFDPYAPRWSDLTNEARLGVMVSILLLPVVAILLLVCLLFAVRILARGY